MAIRTIVTRGFGNGTFSGTIPLVVTRGYSIAEEVVLDPTKGTRLQRLTKITDLPAMTKVTKLQRISKVTR